MISLKLLAANKSKILLINNCFQGNPPNLSYSEKPDDFQLKNKIADLLAANGCFNEIMNNSLTKASYYEHLEDSSSRKKRLCCSIRSAQT